MICRCVVVGVLAGTVVPALAAPGDTLIGDPFILGYNGWVDPTPADPGQSPVVDLGPKANWGIHFRTGALQESSDGRYGRGSTSTDGQYTPYLLVNENYVTPSEYVLKATLTTNDDDGFGLVFGFQDKANYFRVGLRNQNSNYGFPKGVAVQKVWGNVPSQIAGPSTSFVPPITDNHTTNYFPIDVEVRVSGNAWSVWAGTGTIPMSQILSGTDPDLSPGKIGVLAWYERSGGAANTPSAPRALWGVETKRIAVTSSDGAATYFSDAFAAASPIRWRALDMTNSAGVKLPGGDDYGNFRLDFRNATIADDSNGYEVATTITPNTDFLAPAVVVDEPGATSLGDYEMKVRLLNLDDDGIGVIVRAQDDNNFYRIHFTTETDEPHGSWLAHQRAPIGMSVQKCRDGLWSQLFREYQADNPWTFTNRTPEHDAVPFDLIVRAVGNQLFVQVIDDPDGAHVVHTYPIITDDTDPILTGTVGLTNWGSGGPDNGLFFSAFGGIASTPLLVECDVIPEPLTVAMLTAGSLLLLRRRRD